VGVAVAAVSATVLGGLDGVVLALVELPVVGVVPVLAGVEAAAAEHAPRAVHG
jgi:hypothetical protein